MEDPNSLVIISSGSFCHDVMLRLFFFMWAKNDDHRYLNFSLPCTCCPCWFCGAQKRSRKSERRLKFQIRNLKRKRRRIQKHRPEQNTDFQGVTAATVVEMENEATNLLDSSGEPAVYEFSATV